MMALVTTVHQLVFLILDAPIKPVSVAVSGFILANYDGDCKGDEIKLLDFEEQEVLATTATKSDGKYVLQDVEPSTYALIRGTSASTIIAGGDCEAFIDVKNMVMDFGVDIPICFGNCNLRDGDWIGIFESLCWGPTSLHIRFWF